MDERQQKVEVGAGLQDSRLNQEFINWLRKWGNRILTVVLVIVAAYAGKMYWDRLQDQWVDNAFADWDSTRSFENGAVQGSYLALLDVASAHQGQAAVPELARLDAAAVCLRTAMIGAEGSGEEAEDLSDAEINEYIDKAEATYREVLTATESDPRKVILAQAARQGVVSALLSRGGDDDFAEAESLLNRIIEVAESTGGLDDQIVMSRELLASLPTLREPIPAVSEDQLPRSATNLPPEPIEVPGVLPPDEGVTEGEDAAPVIESPDAGAVDGADAEGATETDGTGDDEPESDGQDQG